MTVESPQDKPPDWSNRDRSVDLDRIRNLADLIEDVSILISSLITNRIPDCSSHTFNYLISQSDSIALPQIVQGRIIARQLHEVSLTLGTEEGHPTYLSLDIIDEDGSTHISRSGTEEGKDEPDWFIDNNGIETKTEKISQKEINWLIASLVRTNMDGDYSQFDDINFLNPELYEDLTDTLELKATSVSDTGTYIFHDGVNKLDYSLQQKQPLTFSVTFQTAKPGRLIIAQVDCQIGIDVVFFAQEGNERTKLIPDFGDIIHLRELLQQETEISNPVREALGHTDEEPLEVKTDDEDETEGWRTPLGTSVREQPVDLNEDSLDPPDTSAT